MDSCKGPIAAETLFHTMYTFTNWKTTKAAIPFSVLVFPVVFDFFKEPKLLWHLFVVTVDVITNSEQHSFCAVCPRHVAQTSLEVPHVVVWRDINLSKSSRGRWKNDPSSLYIRLSMSFIMMPIFPCMRSSGSSSFIWRNSAIKSADASMELILSSGQWSAKMADVVPLFWLSQF